MHEYHPINEDYPDVVMRLQTKSLQPWVYIWGDLNKVPQLQTITPTDLLQYYIKILVKAN